MKRKLFAASRLAGLIIAGAAAVAYTAPNPPRIGTVTVEFDDDLDDTDDINQPPETSESFGLLT